MSGEVGSRVVIAAGDGSNKDVAWLAPNVARSLSGGGPLMGLDYLDEAVNPVFGPDELFESAWAAMAFALSFQCGAQAPLLNRAASTPSGPGRGLGGVDGSGQAGMIRAAMGLLPDIQRAALIGRIAPDSLPCDCGRSCCVGGMPNPEWVSAISMLTDASRNGPFAGTTADRAVRRAVVVRYFQGKAERESQDKVAARVGITGKTLGAHATRFGAWLSNIEKDARMAMDGYLSGFVEKKQKIVQSVDDFPKQG